MKKQYIDKSVLMAEIEKVIEEPAPSHDQQCPWEDGYWCGLYKAENIVDTIEVKEVNEEYMYDDLEDYAKKESELFAEREYEIDSIDRNALAKGYYWGVKAGAQWQALHSLETIKEMEEQAFLAGVEAEQINKSFSKEELLNKWRKIYETE